MHERRLVCPQEGCGEVFHKKAQLRAHLSAVHTGEARKPYACPVCSRAFPFPSQLERHRLLHATVDHVCAYQGCGFVARTAEALQVHLTEAHAATSVADAEATGATATSKTTAGERTTCTKCGKQLHPQSLRKHMLSQHPAEDAPAAQIFVCTAPGCGRSYTSKKSLRAHWNVVHSDHRFACTACSASFAYKGGLKRHMLAVHSHNPEAAAVTPDIDVNEEEEDDPEEATEAVSPAKEAREEETGTANEFIAKLCGVNRKELAEMSATATLLASSPALIAAAPTPQ